MSGANVESTSSSSPSITDATLKFRLPQWIRNMAENINTFYQDASDIGFFEPPVMKRFVLVGSGPSYGQYVRQHIRKDDCIVSNQTSLKRLMADGVQPHMCIVTDAHPAMLEKVVEVLPKVTNRTAFMLATCVDPRLVSFLKGKYEVFGFHMPPTRGYALLDLVYDSLCPRQVRTNIVQAGNSMNAALLLIAHLQAVGIFPRVEIHFAGVDFAEADGSMTKAFRAYADDNRTICRALQEGLFNITCEDTPGMLKQWLEVPE